MPIRNLWIPLYLFACVILGGASNGGFLANALLQLTGVTLVAWALWMPAASPLNGRARPLMWLLIAILSVVLLQFMPLPQGFWEATPGRAQLSAEATTIGIAYKPKLLALSPHEAIKSAVWLIPSVALGVALLRVPYWQPQHLALAIIAGMVLSVILGAVQLGQGSGSSAYFYEITNRGSMVGFFANSNHLATLLLASIPFITALTSWQFKVGMDPHHFSFVIMSIGLIIVTISGIALNGSLAGIALVGPMLAASCMILTKRSTIRKLGLFLFPLVLVSGFGWMFLTEEGSKALAFEDMQSSSESRQAIWQTTIQAIIDHMPLGSGLGTFAEVYLRYENPSKVSNFYINHAHNDYLELVLEIGVLALPVLLAFLFWWSRNLIRIWLSNNPNPFAFAGAIVSAVILIHSIVDYPLRTAAVSCIFAVSLCLMALPERSSDPS
jgi:O-antigen ligase